MKIRAIECKTLEWVRRLGLLVDGDTVLIALSGGADSVCLARALLALCERLEIKLAAAHYNHRLRGDASERDEAFVRQFCRSFALPLTVGAGDVAEAARQTERGLEETARDMRYAFLEATAREIGATKIATGHHADDNAETVLLHLLRGAGLRGLAGIPPRRGPIVRPILVLERQEIEMYLAELGQSFVEDATNQDTTLRRNALRHQVLPVLRAQNPALAETILRQSEHLRQDNRYLDGLAQKTFGRLQQEGNGETRTSPLPQGREDICLPVAALVALDPAIASRVINLAAQRVDGRADASHVRQVLRIAAGDDPSAETAVGGGIVVRRVYDRLIFGACGKAPSFAPVILPEMGTVLIPGTGCTVTVGADFSKTSAFRFKSIAICGRITVRPRQTGDMIRLVGRGGTKTVKKLMIEEKVPARERESWPIFVDEAGVIAVYRIGIDERVAPEPGDKTIRIVVEDNGNAQRYR